MIKRANLAVALGDLTRCIASSQRLGRDLDSLVNDDAPRVFRSALGQAVKNLCFLPNYVNAELAPSIIPAEKDKAAVREGEAAQVS